MSAPLSFRKERVRMVAILPPSDTPALEAQLMTVIETYLALPVVTQNVLKFELSKTNDRFDETARALGIQTSDGQSVVVVEVESMEKVDEIARDPAFQRIFEDAKQAKIVNASQIVAFSADVMSCVDK